MTPNKMTACQQLISDGIATLIDSSQSPEIDAELLLSHALGQTRSWLLAYQDNEVSEPDQAKYWALIKRRVAGEPMAYIFGEREFWSLTLKVNDSVLIPRPDTEVLVETALELSKKIEEEIKLVDLGTGSGAIAIALRSEFDLLEKNASTNENIDKNISIKPKHFVVTAVDQSSEALTIARENAKTNNVSQIDFKQGFWFKPLANEVFDLIVSNPPYVADNDPHLLQGDVRFEPRTALTSGIDGMRDLGLIINQAPDYINENGYLVLEHGYNQAQKVQALLKARGFKHIETIEDYGGNPRVTFGQWAPNEENSNS